MSVTISEAEDFLNNNRELLDEMLKYQQTRSTTDLQPSEGDERTLSQYHKLRTYLLEKKMGLLNAGSKPGTSTE
jgi:hypothetical protein